MCCFTLDVWGRQHRSRKLRALLFWECLKDSGNRGNLKSIVFLWAAYLWGTMFCLAYLADRQHQWRFGDVKVKVSLKLRSCLKSDWCDCMWLITILSPFFGWRIFCVFTADLNRDFRSRATEKRFKNSKRQTGTDTFGNLLLLKIRKPEIRSEKNVSVVQCETDSKPETTVVLHMRTVNVV